MVHPLLTAKISQEPAFSYYCQLNPIVLQAAPEKKVLVEQVEHTDDDNDIDDVDDSQYRYTPNVAPATPHHLLSSSSINTFEDISASPSIVEASSSVYSESVPKDEKVDHTLVSSPVEAVQETVTTSTTIAETTASTIANVDPTALKPIGELQQNVSTEKETVIPEQQSYRTGDNPLG